MPGTAVALARGNSTILPIHQAAQYIDAVSVRVRLAGPGLAGVTLSLQAPNDQIIALGTGSNLSTVWQASYPTIAPTENLSTPVNKWQPEGDWRLVVANPNGAAADVPDFAVITHGQFVR